jgi:hypothetical protein
VFAVLHTFATRSIQHYSHRFPQDSPGRQLFHILGEVELAFGLWAGVLVALICLFTSVTEALAYLANLNFKEPFFVFVIMTAASTRPIIHYAERIILTVSWCLPLGRAQSAFVSA